MSLHIVSRVCVLAALVFLLAPTICRGQDFVIPSNTLAPLFASLPAPRAESPSPAVDVRKPSTSSDRGVLIPLYVSFATLQVLDGHSTVRALGLGAVERNPLAKGQGRLLAVKAGAAGATILLAEKVRGRSRIGAIVLMAALNSMYATVVAHNYGAFR